jgi:predicted DNA-binding transcriptional regulator AlpA
MPSCSRNLHIAHNRCMFRASRNRSGDLRGVTLLRTKEAADDLLTTDELARMTGLAVITLIHWRAEGRGPAYLKLGRTVRYEREAVAQFFSEHRSAA